jgi:hypothetical protein
LSLWQGKRQEAKGKSKEVLGDFTFLYTVWFYCVHLLNCYKKKFKTKDFSGKISKTSATLPQ